MNIEECRSYLPVEISKEVNDARLTLVRNELRTLAEVFVGHVLEKDFNNKN